MAQVPDNGISVAGIEKGPQQKRGGTLQGRGSASLGGKDHGTVEIMDQVQPHRELAVDGGLDVLVEIKIDDGANGGQQGGQFHDVPTQFGIDLRSPYPCR